jgi:hypothetical protein
MPPVAPIPSKSEGLHCRSVDIHQEGRDVSEDIFFVNEERTSIIQRMAFSHKSNSTGEPSKTPATLFLWFITYSEDRQWHKLMRKRE